MSSTIYSNFAVYSTGMRDDFTTGHDIDLFSEGSEIIIVLAERIDTNVEGSPKWQCDYIGTASQFSSEYIPRMAALFDDDAARSPLFKNGAQFTKRLLRMFYDADPIHLQDFYQKGIRGYSWDSDEYVSVHTESEPVWYNYFSTKRAGFLLGSDQDIELMIQQALMVRRVANYHVWSGRPWLASTPTF